MQHLSHLLYIHTSCICTCACALVHLYVQVQSRDTIWIGNIPDEALGHSRTADSEGIVDDWDDAKV
eukprot:COSAG06_NODE_19219_length_848_cov_3.569166_1_plen_65_part_10